MAFSRSGATVINQAPSNTASATIPISISRSRVVITAPISLATDLLARAGASGSRCRGRSAVGLGVGPAGSPVNTICTVKLGSLPGQLPLPEPPPELALPAPGLVELCNCTSLAPFIKRKR